jgi:hypothetical protein
VSSSNRNKKEQQAQPQEPTPALVAALADFAQAAETRRIENICKTYNAMKASANGMSIQHLLSLADEALGRSSLGLIVTAYSQEKCFMCNKGSNPCEACDAGDSESRGHCVHCNSTGEAPCDFCAGTGWVGNDVIPHELQIPVWRHRLKTTHKLLEKYAKTYTKATLDDLAGRPSNDKQRQAAILETGRLAAKLHALGKSCAITDHTQAEHLTSAEAKVRACLKILS